MFQQDQRFVVGIDGGGSRTTIAALDDELQELARVEVGPTNFRTAGFDAAAQTLQDGIAEVTRKAGMMPHQLAAIGVGLAGAGRPADQRKFEDVLKSLCPVIVVDNDAMPALVSAAGRHFGVVTICGTGSISVGANGPDKRARSGGWGHVVDRGSGYTIGREVFAAVARAADGTGPETALTGRVLERIGGATPTDIIDWLYAQDRHIHQIAAFAAEAVALAGDDIAATGIIVRAADALASDAIAVAQKLDFGEEPFPLVMSGSLFTFSALLRDLFGNAVRAVLPHAVPMLAERDAAVGAAMMGLEALGVALPHALPPLKKGTERRATEQRNPLTVNIHRRPTFDFAALMNMEDQRVAQLITPSLPQIAALIDAIAERFEAGGRIFFTGAGTSGRLAVIDAAECVPTFSTTPEEVAGIIAGGEYALIHAVEGAEDDEDEGRREILARNVSERDSVIGVAASGSTPFVRGTLKEAADRGALTGSIVNVAHAPISALSQHPIVVATGPEVIMGSTRLKAGTAQKLVLNMISTGVMVRVGRTYGNLMVNMKTSNLKLRHRAGVIVSDATGISTEAAFDLLVQSDGDMKTAIAAALLKIPPAEAKQRLNAVKGNLNRL